eukprot:gene8715-8896_t
MGHLMFRGYLLGHYYQKVEAYMKQHLAAQIKETQQPTAAVLLQEAAGGGISQAADLSRQQLNSRTPSSRVKAFARLALATCSPGSKLLPGSSPQRRISLNGSVTSEVAAADDSADEAVCVSSASWSPLTRIGSIGV